MTKLNGSTLRRLKKLEQSPTVWEGDRRSLPKSREYEAGSNLVPIDLNDNSDQPQCILWVDGSMGMVRAMDVVEPGAGQEALVRAFLQAIERPQSPAQPGRPRKILVRDRELQFYMRGVLQDLDISVEHVEKLPLIDEIFANIVEHANTNPPTVPAAQAPTLYLQADLLWRNAPWEHMWDYQVVSIELNQNQNDRDTLYAVVMGRSGLEQGVIFYRSRESLVQFRQRVAQDESEDGLEETFLHQDCLFTLFESAEGLSESELHAMRSYSWPTNREGVYPIFGMLHPLEGGRPFLYEEEAITLSLAIESFNLFWAQFSNKIKSGKFDTVQGNYQIELPSSGNPDSIYTVNVKTLPDLSNELEQLTEEGEYDDESESLIHEDIWPENALFKLTGLPWDAIASLRQTVRFCQLSAEPFPESGEAMSGLLIQTSRNKALELIKQIEDFGGIQGICFNPAESFLGETCELGLMVMGDDELHLFGEFYKEDPGLERSRKKWKQGCKNTKGVCGVFIAMGVTGASRGRPEPQHILGYYEIKLIQAKELGLGTLKSEPSFDFDE